MLDDAFSLSPSLSPRKSYWAPKEISGPLETLVRDIRPTLVNNVTVWLIDWLLDWLSGDWP